MPLLVISPSEDDAKHKGFLASFLSLSGSFFIAHARPASSKQRLKAAPSLRYDPMRPSEKMPSFLAEKL
jgi:hypothetical protein